MRKPTLTPPRPVSLEPRAVGTRAIGAQVALPEPPSFRALRNTALALGALVLGGMFVGAPYRSADALGKALVSGDRQQLEEVIDFAALREDLKAQAAAAVSADADAAQAGLAIAGSALANAMIDTLVRPEMIATARELPVDEDTKARLRLAVKRARVGYDSPMSFSIRVLVPDVSDEPIRVTMRRTAPLTWKVVSVAMPKDLSRLQQLGAPAAAVDAAQPEALVRND